MLSKETLDITMFAVVCLFLLAGFPVAFTLAGTGLVFAGIGASMGIFDFSIFGALPSRIFGNAMTNEVLIAVPLFVFMGVMLERSKVAEELLDSMSMLFGSLRGGLGFSVTIVGALLAASTGIVGATVVTMGLLSLPTMMKRGYSKSLACGSICAAGTLGQIIPPSIVLVLLGDQISNAYVDAQRAIGNWSPEPVSVGDLFAGALLPGLTLVAMYIGYQILMAWLRPQTSPAIPEEEINVDGLAWRIAQAMLPPVILIIAVLGSILSGIATPTEAASVGAMGSIMLAGVRLSDTGKKSIYLGAASLLLLLILSNTLDLRISRDDLTHADMVGIALAGIATLGMMWGVFVSLRQVLRINVGTSPHPVLIEVMRTTLKISSMVFVILVGASVFSLVFRGLGGDEFVHRILSDLPGGKWGAISVVMAVMFVLGFFLDFIEITIVVVPIVAPVLLKMDVNPVWLGVMMAMNLQTSFLTPPFGFALFYLRGVAPREVSTMDIYRGVAPFVLIQIIGLLTLAAFPAIATWLPTIVFQ